MTKRHAEIVGAGFAGLSAACALAQRGWSVRVHERADALRTTGAGIYIYENGLRVLEALGAYEAAVKGAPFAHTREVRDDHNNVVSVHRWGGSRVYSIVRQTVINALAEQARKAGAEIVTNSVGAIASADGELMTAKGQRYKADLIIAADGANSRLRDAFNLIEKRKALVDGCTRLLIAKTPEERQSRDGATTIEYWSGSRRVLYTPCSETEVYIALVMLDSDEIAKATPIDKGAWKRWFPHLAAADRPAGRGGPLRPLRADPPPALVGGQGCSDRRCGARVAAEYRAGRRLRHDERAGARRASGPRERRADGAGGVGARRAADHRPHPAGVGRARLAGHLAAEATRAGLVARGEIEMGGEAAHQDRAAPADGDVVHRTRGADCS